MAAVARSRRAAFASALDGAALVMECRAADLAVAAGLAGGAAAKRHAGTARELVDSAAVLRALGGWGDPASVGRALDAALNAAVSVSAAWPTAKRAGVRR